MMAMVPQACPRCSAPNMRGGQFCDNCRVYYHDGSLTVERVTYNRRFWGSYVLEALLITVTLFIGWLIWLWFTSKDSQTPAKKLLNMYVIKVESGRAISRGDTWLRELVIKIFLINYLASSFTLGVAWLVDAIWVFFDKDRQALHDKMLSQIVVYAAAGLPEAMKNEPSAAMLYAPGVPPATAYGDASQAETEGEPYAQPSMPGSAPTAAGGVQSMALDLQELARLRDQGMITAEEYERRRARLISGE